ncbi:MAG: hypothetical protein KAW56_13175, partial [Candidatus Marinimicrobia bacterium]|nr:hypothetical protein [Candidatus Neomarinimicrobiota bacterium]
SFSLFLIANFNKEDKPMNKRLCTRYTLFSALFLLPMPKKTFFIPLSHLFYLFARNHELIKQYAESNKAP